MSSYNLIRVFGDRRISIVRTRFEVKESRFKCLGGQAPCLSRTRLNSNTMEAYAFLHSRYVTSHVYTSGEE